MTARQHPHLWDVLTYVRWAVEHSDLTPQHRTFAVAVATYYNHREGFARPPWPELMLTFGYSRATIGRATAAIAAAGVWQADTHPKRATRYRFPIGAAVHRGLISETPDLCTGVSSARPQGSHQRDPNQLLEPTVSTSTDAVPRGGTEPRWGRRDVGAMRAVIAEAAAEERRRLAGDP